MARLLVVAALILGVFFRLYAIDAHGFWGDEGITALRSAGYRDDDVIRMLSGPAPVSAGSLAALHRADTRGPSAVISSLASEDAGHPPLYYVLANMWEHLVGSGVAPLRVLSVLFGLLVLPAMYWFAWELFGSRFVAAVCAAVTAISPFTIEYAQQAREYSLWMLWGCIASALLLRSLRERSARWAILYGLCLVLGLYTHTFFLLIVVAHAFYTFVLRKDFMRSAVRRTGAALALAVIAFLPWLWFVVQGVRSSHFGKYIPVLSITGIVYAWGTALAAPLTDLEMYRIAYVVLAVAALAIECVAVVTLVRSTPATQWLLPSSLIASVVLLQIANPGLVSMIRYWVPAMIGLYAALGWWIGTSMRSRIPRRAYIALASLFFIVAAGTLDDVCRSRQTIWWTNAYGAPFAGVVRAIASTSSAAQPPVILGNAGDAEALEDLASLLPANTLVWIPRGRNVPASLRGRRVFVFTRFANLAEQTAGHRPLVPIPVTYPLRGYGVIEVARHPSLVPKDTWLWSVRT